MTSHTGFRLVVGAAVIAVAVAAVLEERPELPRSRQRTPGEGERDAAVLEYRNAVEKDPMFAPARVKLGDAYLRQGNIAGALAELVRAADLLPNDTDAQLKAGSLLYAAGRPKKQWPARRRRSQ